MVIWQYGRNVTFFENTPIVLIGRKKHVAAPDFRCFHLTIMFRRSFHQLSLLAALLLTVSCSTKDKSDLDKRLENRTDRYSSFQDRRGMRTRERQERTDRWYDRVMALPPRNDTGLKLPD